MCLVRFAPRADSLDQAGATFAFAKATEGLDYVDSSFGANMKGMRTENFSPRGYYHFGHPNESASLQAAHFCKTVGTLHAEEVAVLDIEASDGVHPDQVAQWSKDFVDGVMSRLGLPASRVFVCQPTPTPILPLPFTNAPCA